MSGSSRPAAAGRNSRVTSTAATIRTRVNRVTVVEDPDCILPLFDG
jgi:hypothetical protein